MEDQRFDQLSRRLAGLGSRRRALKVLAASLVASVAGSRSVAAQSCSAHYTSCSLDSECCPGAVCQWGLCMPGCRIADQFTNAWTPEPGNPCARCAPEVSTTAWSPANSGMACWSGDLCSGPSTCQNGACTSTAPVSCTALTPCHLPGECDPGTGVCSHPSAPSGTPCGGTATCFGGFYSSGLICDGNGACTGGPTTSCSPYVCGDGACLTSCASDSECASGFTCCGGTCLDPATIDFNTDRNHCGGCGRACPPDEPCLRVSCSHGVCIGFEDHAICEADGGTCFDFQTCCPGRFIDFDTNVNNCGACGNVCVPENPCRLPVCSNGTCGDSSSQSAAYGTPCTGASFEGACDGLGTCLPICFPITPSGPPPCTSDDACPGNEICLHGGCFSICTEVDAACTTGCDAFGCTCHQPVGDRPPVCVFNSPPGFDCASDSACATWQICDQSRSSGNSIRPYLCSLPCPVPFFYDFS